MSNITTIGIDRQTIVDQTFAAMQASQAERREHDRQVVEENREWCERNGYSPEDARGLFA